MVPERPVCEPRWFPPAPASASGARPPRQVGRCVAPLHAIMTFGVMCTFPPSPSLSPSFLMRTGARLMTAPGETEHHATDLLTT